MQLTKASNGNTNRLKRKPGAKTHRKKRKPNHSELLKKIKSLYITHLRKGVDSMKEFIEMGKAAEEYKAKVSHGEFTKNIEGYLGIDLKLVQRAKKLATTYNFDQYPVLYYAPRTHLESIMRKAGENDVMEFIQHDHKIDLDFSPDDKYDLMTLLKDIKNLADSKSTKTTKNSTRSREDDEQEETRSERNKTTTSGEPKISPQAIVQWANRIRDKKLKSGGRFSEKSIAQLEAAVDSLKRLIEELSS